MTESSNQSNENVVGAVAAAVDAAGDALQPLLPLRTLLNDVYTNQCGEPVRHIWAKSDFQQDYVSPADPSLFKVPAHCPPAASDEDIQLRLPPLLIRIP